eukprot:gnl/TRDRNA2_/TRDRNA2_161793_c0_seq2.p2 gnl/TRDRNA2_/TRDRNA2_161793_c0~~gnl/TRDRNA2_/TRDRNA2_161793_c0_seq2.p2  ORF type:complete len:124 (-),score=17.64 gnl/TRDRNA2_/TRDRNA2_161793_c0_seq2:64-435(-)
MTIEKTYTKRTTISKEEDTALVATFMPFTIVNSSGIALISRVIRDRRSSRSSRSGPVGSDLLSAPAKDVINGKAQVSATMRNTSAKSNLNQKSIRQSDFLAKAKKRMQISRVKKAQKAWSHIW